jgi:hypothetical protein
MVVCNFSKYFKYSSLDLDLTKISRSRTSGLMQTPLADCEAIDVLKYEQERFFIR